MPDPTIKKRQIVVPEGMLKASLEKINESGHDAAICRISLEAGIRWLTENPIIPTHKQLESLRRQGCKDTAMLCGIWASTMFLALEPEVPQAVKDLQIFVEDILARPAGTLCGEQYVSDLMKIIHTAYTRGVDSTEMEKFREFLNQKGKILTNE